MIEAAIKTALEKKTMDGNFSAQLQKNREFYVRMERAGVTARKQSFTIPLMERIVQLQD